MRMDIADLRLFLAVADAGSITAGAAQANLALGSASERLRAIEDDAGTALLDRHPRGVSLTEAGATLVHHARLILQQQAQLRGELQAFAHGARGTLHLYANTAALTSYLPPRLAPWLAERPRLHVELHERTSSEIVRAITAGQAEAGMVVAVEARVHVGQRAAEHDAGDAVEHGVHVQVVGEGRDHQREGAEAGDGLDVFLAHQVEPADVTVSQLPAAQGETDHGFAHFKGVLFC